MNRALLAIFLLSAPASLYGQPRRIEPGDPAANPSSGSVARRSDDLSQDERQFFEQLRTLFGRFSNADLADAFEMAGAIECSELVTGKGEWKEVAFFNEDRKLGDWYRRSIGEVRIDPSTYTFKGSCSNSQGDVQLTTRYPVEESLQAYNRSRIRFDQIAINENPPVRVVYSPRTRAYMFDLPYLFLASRQGDRSVYTLIPRRLTDRYGYAPEVTDRWECKSVKGDDVTYRFIICRTRTISVERGPRTLPFGASAYFILSDGKEAGSTVKLVFDTNTSDATANTKEADRGATEKPNSAAVTTRLTWEVPRQDANMEALADELRLRFSAQTWTGKIESPQTIASQRFLESTTPPSGVDYCTWNPTGSPSLLARLLSNDPDESVAYSVSFLDKDAQTDASILFQMKTYTGSRLGILRCYFPKTQFAGAVAYSRWLSLVGAHLTLEVRP
jgi:hypothetical protein